MGTVVRFAEPARRVRRTRSGQKTAEPATVVILPVIRIERYTEGPPDTSPSHRRRRRPVARQ